MSKTINGLTTRHVTLVPNEETIFEYEYDYHYADIVLLGDVSGPVFFLENETVSIDNAKAIKLDGNVKGYEIRLGKAGQKKTIHVISAHAVEVQIVARHACIMGGFSICDGEQIKQLEKEVAQNTQQLADMTVDVSLIGAKCDGITDDWEVIQNFINNNLSNYNLSFPMNKLCYISKPLVISGLHSNIHLIGQLGAVLYTDKQIALMDFQGSYNYSGSGNVIRNCSIENLTMVYSLTKSNNFNDLLAFGGMSARNPDNYSGNIHSIGIKANAFYTNQIMNCRISGFGYGIQFNSECARNIIADNNIKNCRVAIYCEKGLVCNANIIRDNDISNNLGLAIFIDVGGANVIRDNDIEACRRAITQLPNNEILLKDVNGSEVKSSVIYLNNCSKTTITGNFFEGNNRWNSGLCVSDIVQLDAISKVTTLLENNYYNISNMSLDNSYTQDILGNSIINFEDGIYLNEGGAANLIGDNLVINSEALLNISSLKSNKTITPANLDYLKNYRVNLLSLPDTTPCTITDSDKFNRNKVINFDANGNLFTTISFRLLEPKKILQPGKSYSIKYGCWVKSSRIGTVTIYPLYIDKNNSRPNTKRCSQFNSKENEWQFVTGNLSIKNNAEIYSNGQLMIYFIPPRSLVSKVEKVSDTKLKVYGINTVGDTGTQFKIGDTLTLSDGKNGVITSTDNYLNYVIIDGTYTDYTPSGITHVVVTNFKEGSCNVSIQYPQVACTGTLQPYNPDKMKKTIIKEYILDESGKITISSDEFGGKYAIAENAILKYVCGGTACSGEITFNGNREGYLYANKVSIAADINTSGTQIVNIWQDNIHNISYKNLGTLTSKKLIIKWWIPEEA